MPPATSCGARAWWSGRSATGARRRRASWAISTAARRRWRRSRPDRAEADARVMHKRMHSAYACTLPTCSVAGRSVVLTDFAGGSEPGGLAQRGVDAGLPALAAGPEVLDHVGVEHDRDPALLRSRSGSSGRPPLRTKSARSASSGISKMVCAGAKSSSVHSGVVVVDGSASSSSSTAASVGVRGHSASSSRPFALPQADDATYAAAVRVDDTHGIRPSSRP